MPGIKVHPNESFEEAYRKFKKQVDRNLVVTEVRARRFFEPMTEIRKKQKISARKKNAQTLIYAKAIRVKALKFRAWLRLRLFYSKFLLTRF